MMALYALAVAIPAGAQQTDIGWPRTVQSDHERIQIYQPQIDQWADGKLAGRAAIVVTTGTTGQGVYGVVWISARTALDTDKRMVTLYDVDVTRASFPSAAAQEPAYIKNVTEALTHWNMTIALDRLLADLAITQTEEKSRGEALSMEPPKIYLRENPAVLILIDGDPRMKQVMDTDLMQIINSPAVIVLDTSSGQYYLQGDGYWMSATTLQGPWSLATDLPPSLGVVLEQEANPKTAAPVGAPPEVIVSTEPGELIQLKGQPQFSPISGTQLLYAANTDSDVFMMMGDQRYYVLLSGRWFSSMSLNGPWDFVPASSLPTDFSHIPPGCTKASVLASVPGTSQARDALVAAQVPQTATVDRATAQFTATYDGDPQFKPIEGTDMSYAANSPNDVIQVGNNYYAVSDGVWFVATDPRGPWSVCTYVPPEIYSMPPSSPVYNDKFVYVYDSTPEYVYVGYTPGYFGSFIWDGVVVYGTGFWYPCWADQFWYGCPWTWGFGFQYVYRGGGYFWRPWYPLGWNWRPHRYEPEYALWSRRVLYNRSIDANITRQAPRNVSVYDRWPSSAAVSRHPVSLRSAASATPSFAPPAASHPDLYAGHDGHVYDYRSDGWYRQNGQTWEKVTPRAPAPSVPLQAAPVRPVQPAPTRPPQVAPLNLPPQMQPRPAPAFPQSTIQQLDQERQARIQGQQRSTSPNYPRVSPPSAPSRPSGGGFGAGAAGGGRR